MTGNVVLTLVLLGAVAVAAFITWRHYRPRR